MAKPAFPKELLLDSIEVNNFNWLQEYKSETTFSIGYYQQLENFFRFKLFANKPFNLFTENDVSEYIEVMIDNDYSMSRINTLVFNLASFRQFLIEKHSHFFSQYFLININELKLGQPEKKYSESQALNYHQLELVKKYIQNNERTEYIFQIFYQLGIDKKDFEICTPENVIQEKQLFIMKNKTIAYNNTISDLLNKVQVVPNFKATTHMITDH